VILCTTESDVAHIREAIEGAPMNTLSSPSMQTCCASSWVRCSSLEELSALKIVQDPSASKKIKITLPRDAWQVRKLS